MNKSTTLAGRAADAAATKRKREDARILRESKTAEELRLERRATAARKKAERDAEWEVHKASLGLVEEVKEVVASRIDGATVEGLVKVFLLPRYDDPKPIPVFHRALWDMCCVEGKYVVVAAPRGHAKSTAVTHAYLLAKVLFRESRFVLLVSDTEGQAAEFLGGIRNELQTNEELISTFGVSKVVKDTETDIIVRMTDGWEFRVIAKGSEQKVRGLKWNSGRPDLIIGDDLENDEIVMNPDRREKFMNWVMKALIPCGSDSCLVRVVGTILHFDSMLERFLGDVNWVGRRFSAHSGYDDFSCLLWPEKFPEERLRAIRKRYEAQGMPEGYSQEYLNVPMSEQNSFFRKADFLGMKEEDRRKKKTFYVVGDLAISKAERSDYTVFGVVGVDEESVLHVVHVERGRLDSWEITERMFALQKLWKPEMFGVEQEKISKALGPFLNREMIKRGIFMNFPDPPLIPTKDKRVRAQAIMARMRAGGVRFDMEADWFHPLQEELLRFPRGAHDDYVDMLSWIGLMLDRLMEAPTATEIEEEEYHRDIEYVGRSVVCGY